MDLGLQGKRAAVMASSSGLGRACALALAREGARVAICGRDAKRLETAAAAISKEAAPPSLAVAKRGGDAKGTHAEVVPVVADVSKAEDVQRFIDSAAKQFGGLDILVTNKGGPPGGKFDQHDDQAWQRGFELVVMSYVRAVRAAMPHFRKAGGGSVVSIESTSVKQPILQLPLSSSLRSAVAGLSKTLALEHGREGIRFNVVLPGSFDTDRIRDLNKVVAREHAQSEDEAMNARIGAIPLQRLGMPQEIGELVAFLASPRAEYITGGVFACDGGATRGTW